MIVLYKMCHAEAEFACLSLAFIENSASFDTATKKHFPGNTSCRAPCCSYIVIHI